MLDILLVFIALKLVSAVDWSWGAVLIPLWLGLASELIELLISWWLGLD